MSGHGVMGCPIFLHHAHTIPVLYFHCRCVHIHCTSLFDSFDENVKMQDAYAILGEPCMSSVGDPEG